MTFIHFIAISWLDASALLFQAFVKSLGLWKYCPFLVLANSPKRSKRQHSGLNLTVSNNDTWRVSIHSKPLSALEVRSRESKRSPGVRRKAYFLFYLHTLSALKMKIYHLASLNLKFFRCEEAEMSVDGIWLFHKFNDLKIKKCYITVKVRLVQKHPDKRWNGKNSSGKSENQKLGRGFHFLHIFYFKMPLQRLRFITHKLITLPPLFVYTGKAISQQMS